MESIENDLYVKKWLKNINEKHHKSYISQLTEFCELFGKTPTQLINDEHRDKQKEPKDQVGISEFRIRDFYNYLQGQTINDKTRERICSRGSSITYAYGNISGFFANNRLPIIYTHKIPQHIKKATKKNWYLKDKLVDIDDLKYVLSLVFSNLKSSRDKAIFLSELSSALYSVDLMKLKIKDFKQGLNFNNKEICLIQGLRQKTEIGFTTFFSSETCKMIEIYLKERENRKEILTDDSYLFVSEYPMEVIKDKNDNPIERKFKKCKTSAFRRVIQESCQLLEIKGFTPKSLRDYFETMVEKKIPTSQFNMLVGYKGNTEVSSYKISQIRDLAETYRDKIESIVSIGNGINSAKQINQDIEILKEQISEKDLEIGKLQKSVNDIRDILELAIKESANSKLKELFAKSKS